MVHAISEKVSSHVGLFLKHDQLVANNRQILMKTLNILHLVRIKEQFLIKMPTLEIYRGINVSKYHQGTHANTRLNIFSLLTRRYEQGRDKLLKDGERLMWRYSYEWCRLHPDTP